MTKLLYEILTMLPLAIAAGILSAYCNWKTWQNVVVSVLIAMIAVTANAEVPVIVINVGLDDSIAKYVSEEAVKLIPPGYTEIKATGYAEFHPGPYPNPVNRWNAALCKQDWVRREEIILVLERRGGVNGQANVCVSGRKCAIAYVAVDPRDLRASIIAAAHEIMHGLGARHLGGCNLMSWKALSCTRNPTRVRRDSLREVEACLSK